MVLIFQLIVCRLEPISKIEDSASIREAEAMSTAGIKNPLITTDLIGKPKIERLIPYLSDKLAALSLPKSFHFFESHQRQLVDCSSPTYSKGRT